MLYFQMSDTIKGILQSAHRIVCQNEMLLCKYCVVCCHNGVPRLIEQNVCEEATAALMVKLHFV